jgi:hypothetical protein
VFSSINPSMPSTVEHAPAVDVGHAQFGARALHDELPGTMFAWCSMRVSTMFAPGFRRGRA